MKNVKMLPALYMQRNAYYNLVMVITINLKNADKGFPQAKNS